MLILPEQCRAARALLNLSQDEIAESAHITGPTIGGFERHGKAPTYNNLQAIRAALEAAGVQFIDPNGGGPGVRLRRTSKTKAAKETALSPEQCRAARAFLDLSQIDLARAAGLGRSTVGDFEAGARTPSPESLATLRATLEAAGVEFIDADGGGPGVRSRE